MTSPKSNPIQSLADKVQTAECKSTLQFWLDTRGDNIAPFRHQLNVEELSRSLPFVSILEYQSESRCIFKFVGSELNTIQGTEITGLNFFDLAPPDQRELRQMRMRESMRLPCANYASITGTLSDGTVNVQETLAMPYLADGPGQFPGLIAAVRPVASYELKTPALKPEVINMGSAFHFVDIGAGVPDNLDVYDCVGILSV